MRHVAHTPDYGGRLVAKCDLKGNEESQFFKPYDNKVSVEMHALPNENVELTRRLQQNKEMQKNIHDIVK